MSLIQIISSNVQNTYTTELRYHIDRRVDKRNTCRSVVLDIMLLDCKNKSNYMNHTHKKTTRNVQTQVENKFFRSNK